MPRTLVKHALDAAAPNDTLLLQGWVRTRRDAKAFSFIELNDGSCLKGIQVIADAKLANYTTEILHAHTGSSVEVRGKLLPSQGQGQKWEVIAESVVVLNPTLVNAMPYLRKTSMQLASKMRFVSAQIIALLENDLWRRNAEHANSMAKRLDAGLRAMGVEIPNPTEANAVFPIFTAAQTEKLQESYRFYVWNYATGQVRLMCAWDTTEADVDGMLAAVKSVLA